MSSRAQRVARKPAEGNEITRSLALGQEVDVAIGLLEQGLAAVHGDVGSVGAAGHLQLALLSTGLERLLKCILAFRIRENTGRFPRGGEIRRTHDVESLLDEVLATAFHDDYLKRPAARVDKEFLENDPDFRAFLRAVTEFAEPLGRYWKLNVAMGASATRPSPESRWHDVEQRIMQESGLGERLEGLGDDDHDIEAVNLVFEELSNTVVALFERAFRSLCSLFVYGALGYEGTTVGSLVSEFVFLRDEDLGKRHYAARGLLKSEAFIGAVDPRKSRDV